MKYQVWAMRNFVTKKYAVKTVKEGVVMIEGMIDRDLKNPNITDNAFGLEVFEGGEWSEYYDRFGRDVDEIIKVRWDKRKGVTV